MRWPVVVTVSPQDPIRLGFAFSVLAYWTRHAQADVHVISIGYDPTPEARRLWEWCKDMRPDWYWLNLTAEGSQRERHIIAVEIAAKAGARYVWSADDDVMPRPECDLDVAAALMDAHPEYAVVALDLPSCPLPHGADGGHSGPIVEAGGVGGLRALRVDAFRDFAWPAMDPRMGGRYDVTLCTAVRTMLGKKVGAFGDAAPRHLRAMHLGEYLSTFEWPYPVARSYPRRWDE